MVGGKPQEGGDFQAHRQQFSVGGQLGRLNTTASCIQCLRGSNFNCRPKVYFVGGALNACQERDECLQARSGFAISVLDTEADARQVAHREVIRMGQLSGPPAYSCFLGRAEGTLERHDCFAL